MVEGRQEVVEVEGLELLMKPAVEKYQLGVGHH